ncbi:hypothetical protein WAI453_012861 [Rhynchosporium graminicola]
MSHPLSPGHLQRWGSKNPEASKREMDKTAAAWLVDANITSIRPGSSGPMQGLPRADEGSAEPYVSRAKGIFLIVA